MKFEEFIKTECNKLGNRVWVCDYRHNDISNKPIRHVEPKEVEIFSNDDLPKGKTVYYSDIHFRPVGVRGSVLHQIIAPFDNTGYRSNTGDSLNVFLTKRECVEHYIKQSREVQSEIITERERLNERLDKMVEDIEVKIKKLLKD